MEARGAGNVEKHCLSIFYVSFMRNICIFFLYTYLFVRANIILVSRRLLPVISCSISVAFEICVWFLFPSL